MCVLVCVCDKYISPMTFILQINNPNLLHCNIFTKQAKAYRVDDTFMCLHLSWENNNTP